MLNYDQKLLKQHDKLQNIGGGISTKNYVAFDMVQKKWRKIKQSSLINKQLLEQYLYKYILLFSQKRLNKNSCLSLKNITINVKEQKKQGQRHQSYAYYIEREYIGYGLMSLFQASPQIKGFLYKDQVSQLLKLFIQNSEQQFPLSIPSNFLLQQNWDNKTFMYFNFTSLVGYQLFIEQEDIYVKIFEKICCYLHPSIFDCKQTKFNINFKTKLYSFAVMLLTITLNKQISFPLNVKFNQTTINIKGVKSHIEQVHKKLKQFLVSKKVKQSIKSREKIWKFTQKLQLQKFLKDVIINQSKQINSWIDVIRIFDKDFLKLYIEKTEKWVLKPIIQLYKAERQQQKHHYEKMGLVKPLDKINNDSQSYLMYFFLKYNYFQELRYLLQQKNKDIYEPNLYHFSKKISVQLKYKQQRQKANMEDMINLQSKEKINQQNRQSSEIEVESNIQQEINQSMAYNVFSSQIQDNQYDNEDNQENGQKDQQQQSSKRSIIIYRPNEYQQTLDIYGARLWL